MKCPACQTDSKKTERTLSACPKCARLFKLDPPIAGVSDYAVDAMIEKLTDRRTYKYAKRQLAAVIERRLTGKRRKVRVVGAVLASIALATATIAGAAELYPLLIGVAVLLLIALLVFATAGFDPASVGMIVNTFGPTPLQVEPRRGPPPRTGGVKEFDLQSYGFDRVIVVQGDDIVEMLVQNQFHFQHNAAIVSFDGYPAHVAALVDKQVYENQATPIVVLHDATADGYGRAAHWLAARRVAAPRITRAGLTPRQVAKVRPHGAPVGVAPKGLTPKDASWLAARGVTIAALKPGQVMTLLFNAMQRPPTPRLASASGGDDVGFFVVDADGGYDFG